MKGQEAAVSVIIAVYNAERYLDRCVSSVCRQTYTSLEIILVDDGSTDSSALLCDRWSERDARIKVLHQDNAGVSAARNTGIEAAGGKYIAFLDSDDWIEPDFVKTLLEKHRQGDLVLSGYMMDYGEGGKQIKRLYSKQKDCCYLSCRDALLLYDKNLLNPIWNKLYERKVIARYGIAFREDMDLGEDIVFNLEYLQNIDGRICVVNQPLYHYSCSENSSLGSRYHEHFVDMQRKIFNSFFAYLDCVSAGREQEERVCMMYFNALIAAMDNLYLHRHKLEHTVYHRNMQLCKREPEIGLLLKRLRGKNKWIYSIRYFFLAHGLYIVDFYLRKALRCMKGME